MSLADYRSYPLPSRVHGLVFNGPDDPNFPYKDIIPDLDYSFGEVDTLEFPSHDTLLYNEMWDMRTPLKRMDYEWTDSDARRPFDDDYIRFLQTATNPPRDRELHGDPMKPFSREKAQFQSNERIRLNNSMANDLIDNGLPNRRIKYQALGPDGKPRALANGFYGVQYRQFRESTNVPLDRVYDRRVFKTDLLNPNRLNNTLVEVQPESLSRETTDVLYPESRIKKTLGIQSARTYETNQFKRPPKTPNSNTNMKLGTHMNKVNVGSNMTRKEEQFIPDLNNYESLASKKKMPVKDRQQNLKSSVRWDTTEPDLQQVKKKQPVQSNMSKGSNLTDKITNTSQTTPAKNRANRYTQNQMQGRGDVVTDINQPIEPFMNQQKIDARPTKPVREMDNNLLPGNSKVNRPLYPVEYNCRGQVIDLMLGETTEPPLSITTPLQKTRKTTGDMSNRLYA